MFQLITKNTNYPTNQSERGANIGNGIQAQESPCGKDILILVVLLIAGESSANFLSEKTVA